jgi:hypothetical protein
MISPDKVTYVMLKVSFWVPLNLEKNEIEYLTINGKHQ